MNTQEVANRLVELCRKGEYMQAQEELYGDAIESHEPAEMGMPVAKGREAVAAKTQQWAASVEEVHSAPVPEPLIAGNHFTVTMENDITFKERGRMEMREVCVYEVQEGKIVKENFFYSM